MNNERRKSKDGRLGIIVALCELIIVCVVIGISLVVVKLDSNDRDDKKSGKKHSEQEVAVEKQDDEIEEEDVDITEIEVAVNEAETETTEVTTEAVTEAQEVSNTMDDIRSEYILYESDVRYLTEQDLVGLSKDQLRYARNEIYARHGRKFKDAELQAYFDSKSWYTGTIEPDGFSESLLNEYEKANTAFIKEAETK